MVLISPKEGEENKTLAMKFKTPEQKVPGQQRHSQLQDMINHLKQQRRG